MKLVVVPEERITVDLGGGDSVTWQIANELPKPFIHPLTLSGNPVTLASPYDHVHHRGIMFAMKVDDVNYWEEGEGPGFGVQRVKSVDGIWCDRESARFSLQIEWIALGTQGGRQRAGGLAEEPAGGAATVRAESSVGPARLDGAQGSAHIAETRSFLVERIERGILITWRSRLVAEGVPGVVLSGKTPHAAVSYYGLGVRFSRAMDLSGEHLNAAGGRGVDETHGSRAAWHDYAGLLDEANIPVGIAVFDHPKNPRHPTEWFAMQRPFAYVSASLVATRDYPLVAGEPLELTYGLWVRPGQATRDEIEAVYRGWSASGLS